MRRPKRAALRPTLAHGVMVLAGLVTFVLVASVLRDRSATVTVVAAAEAVEPGTPGDQVRLQHLELDADSPLLEHLARPEDLNGGRVVRRRLGPGQPVMVGDLAAGGNDSGERTVVVPVERLVLEGLGLRGEDEVDVIALDANGSSRYAVAGASVARVPGEEPLGLGRAAETGTTWLTLRVSDDEALQLAAALGGGEVVVVRSTGAPPATVTVPRLEGTDR